MDKDYQLWASDMVIVIAIQWGKLLLRQPPQKINTFLFADDQVLKDDSEKNVDVAKRSKNFGVEISPEKIETMTF
jgi:hypothetical protein